MGYSVIQTTVSRTKHPLLTEYFDTLSEKTEHLYNAALFRHRQRFTMVGKDVLSANEQEVLAEIEQTVRMAGCGMPKRTLTYWFLEKLMRVTGNPDFFSGLPMQTSQQILRQSCEAMKGWLEAMRAYRKDPSAFTGKPKMPGYHKGGRMTITFTNQDCRIRSGMLKFPLTKERLCIHVPQGGRLKEVQVRPFCGAYRLICIFEDDQAVRTPSGNRTAAIDFGVSNIASIVVNDEHVSPVIYKGGALKAANQWFNKRRAQLVSSGTSGKASVTKEAHQTKQLLALSRRREDFLRDQTHKISSDIVRYLTNAGVSVLVLGRNKQQKQNSGMGRKNNQSFVSLPMYTLQQQIRYKAENAGILVTEQEESYTSKASFADRDMIPVYGEEAATPVFSGRRKGRGLYVSADGRVFNADVNAAANILRKAFPEEVRHITDHRFLQNVRVIRFYDLNQKRTPVKRIAAV